MKLNAGFICRKANIAFAAALFVFPALNGEVFWPLPFRGRSSVDIVSGMPGVTTPARPLFKERVVYNGVSAELTVWTARASLQELAVFFKKALPEAVFSGGGKQLKVAVGGRDGIAPKRILVSAGSYGGATVFALDLAQSPPAGGIKWPAALPPLSTGERAGSVIEFPDRRAVFGSVLSADGAADPQLLLRRTAARLRSAGWMPAGHEASVSIGGSGDIFITSSPRRILLVSYDDSGNGIYYLREEKK